MLCNIEKTKHSFIKTYDDNGDLLHVKIANMVNFNEQETHFFIRALRVKKIVDNSQEYKQKLLHTKMTQKRGRTNLEVYNHWRSGFSNYDSMVDNDLDYFVTLYPGKKGTLGYTSMSSGKIYINRQYYKYWMNNGDEGISGLIGNLNHEYMHSMGYIHRGFWSYKRNSVPYVYGREARYLALEHLQGRALTPLLGV